MRHLSLEELQAGLDGIRQAPKDEGRLELIVRRPAVDCREVLEEGRLDPNVGLVGDTWNQRASPRMKDGSPHPDAQINMMGSRVAALVAQSRDRWQLAGDQLFVDLDLSGDNLPPGTQLAIGTAVVEITELPHTGCSKFVSRFGVDAMKFVNSAVGRALNLRGVNAKVIKAGTVKPGDAVVKFVKVR
jgi:hypothetical protein